ncbi:dihydrolipoyl dehydrogenase family protein [Halopelagius longus]|uniref:Dihydrolipoamide dehydrogenase n=1 Tax=Halopelagius longus TaxID=1236180 RepID=A0A1H1FYQ4_9EURY|nr:dihydrolipoyl dehydrogenase [Halopelagius longus]RDI69961.1 dihydrolipoamide dehydrogenase [Halopelagius longus]SDR05758.1 dihydrolipoamide dehydrogenase [Halopelagius longus]
MEEYDLIVLGGGTGNIVASEATAEGLDVALVERGRLGGTCLNRGCNPSKRLIHSANVAETVRNAEQFGVEASLDGVAFADVVDGVAQTMAEKAESKAERARKNDRLTLYRAEGRFVDEHTVEVSGDDDTGGGRLSADRIVLAGGSRPTVPDSIDGTDRVDYLTSAEVLTGEIDGLPDRLVIVGGGYIAVEMGHFFSQMGSDVTIVGHGETLVDREDADIAEQVTDAYREEHELRLGYTVTEMADEGGEKRVTAESEGGEEITVAGDELLVATGRRPNSDLWNVSAAGIETDEKGFVETDEYLRTSVEGVWAIGDVAGNYMFKHSGDKEAEYAVENAVRGNEREVSYPGMAHAIFGSPEVGSLGKTEAEIGEDVEYDVGTYSYEEQALGGGIDNKGGFAKAIVADDGEILGVHVVGPEASSLIHEVSTAVAAGADATTLAETIHVHPALSEVVQGAFRDVTGVAASGI